MESDLNNNYQYQDAKYINTIWKFSLTLYEPNSFFRRFSGHNLR